MHDQSSERIFQSQLDAPCGRDNARRPAESRRLQQSRGDAEVSAIRQVEYVHTETDGLSAGEWKPLDRRKVNFKDAPCAEGVARHSSIASDRRQQRARVCGQAQRLTALARPH